MDGSPTSWLPAVYGFHRRWFPSATAIQHFWFGARKQGLRAFFGGLADDYGPSLQVLAQTALLWPTHLGCLMRLRLRAAIFLDQMSRNIAALRGDVAQTLCDASALRLALSVLADVPVGNGAALLAVASPAELCFLSLALRHSRHPPLISLAAQILESMASELPQLELCSRFLAETRDAAEAVAVEAYLAHALSEDEPLLLGGCGAGSRLEVLDVRCKPPFLEALLASRERWAAHGLVEVLRRTLGELGLLSCERGLVLSLSGGVDSMVTCCLLWLLSSSLEPSQRFRWCALHLRHPNRGDAEDEEGWVRWLCGQLQVELLSYRVGIRRPHGGLRTGISRERYEEKSKELRFRMYERCLARLGLPGAALVAHHQDDADENRLAELGKGNVLHIDGMALRSSMLGVEVVRPLLSVRKAELIAFADAARVCYMQDSTPKWSRRGWIRRTLNKLEEQDAAVHRQLLTALERAGAASEALGAALDVALRGWERGGVAEGELCGGVAVVVLPLSALVTLAVDFEPRLAELSAEFRGIADVWNAAVDAQGGPPPTEEQGEGEDGEGEEEAAGACPLQRIPATAPKAGPFLLARAISAAAERSSGLRRLLRGQLATRKALAHLWDCIARARREYQWGALHKRCPCLYLQAEACLVLLDAEDLQADGAWQRSFAAAAAAFARRCSSEEER